MKTAHSHPRGGAFGTAAALLFAATCATAGEKLDTKPLVPVSLKQTIEFHTEGYVNRQFTEKYPLAAELDRKGWFSVDLKPLCNIGLYGGGGKTCPVSFPHMALGRQTFYGVPFEIIAPAANENRTAIAMPSKRLLTTELPDKVAVPVRHYAKVLYILLASYYTLEEGEQYVEATYEDGSSVKLPIVGTVDTGDWYHAHTRINTEHTRCVLVPRTPGSKTEFRNMHIIEWINPSPAKRLHSITFKTDRTAPMALLIAAVTGWDPEAR